MRVPAGKSETDEDFLNEGLLYEAEKGSAS
jgi:hypothetical protein